MKTRTLILTALFAALTGMGALIRIPMAPVPITLQLLFCIMAGLVLKPVPAAASQLVYIALGLLGLPIFSGGGGLGYVLKPSFGYLIGFVAGAFVCAAIIRRVKRLTWWKALLSGMACVLCVYIIGVPYMVIMLNAATPGAMDAGKAIVSGFLVFLPGDAAKALLAALVAVKARPALLKTENH